MISAYLWLNSLLYTVFAIWCTLSWKKTSETLGYLSLSNSGQSEYLVIYGGLQLGLAMFFAICAYRPDFRGAGLTFALMLYGGIVLYRLVTVVVFRPVSGATMTVAVLEVTLLLAGMLLTFGRSTSRLS